MNCHLAITRVKFIYLIDACVLRRKLNRRFHNKRSMRDLRTEASITQIYHFDRPLPLLYLPLEEAVFTICRYLYRAHVHDSSNHAKTT